MTLVHRVLYPSPIASLDEYLARGGGAGLEKALTMDHDAIIAEVLASGLRGRGGAGFPTGIKWRTVRDYHAESSASTVVVNGAEGEPGTFKDRTIIRIDPYAVIEGALIAARAVGADEVVIATKRSFGREAARLKAAVAEVRAANWAPDVRVVVFEGPAEYLYGEETALLEVLDGRYPFPRIAPPYRRGERELVETYGDVRSRSNLSSHVEMAGPGDDNEAPPTLVDNVETLANVPRIISRGAAWFRTEGTEKSPGTIVCTIIGDVEREGVGEVIMGTTLRDAIHLIAGGPREGRTIKAVLPGVSNPVITADQLDTPLTYEDMQAIGSGLGSAGFLVFDDTVDMASVAAGVARFLAVESCGQCTPCKQDGVSLAAELALLCHDEGTKVDLTRIRSLASTVGDHARCYLGTQQQVVIESILAVFGDELAAHVSGAAPGTEPRLIAELVDITPDGAVVDEHHLAKQPDWTFDATDSGQAPADRYDEHRRPRPLGD
ncbi:MAG TPA: NADH-ubiquinone oxidoreductase-F iron-sulfur binding region domain-containing protein [Acidimicrobiia bacterium]|jgi:NADH-quinone oxidoreductase subunit F|nr:NADH-ubiquinone oxidoreductase-F iron-sulfur binding region domain-containing protein [Acidimicrobiia bacterium]